MELIALQLSVGMTTDDEVQPWEGIGHINILLIAQMGEQDGDIALLTKPLVLAENLTGWLETDSLQIVGMGTGNALR